VATSACVPTRRTRRRREKWGKGGRGSKRKKKRKDEYVRKGAAEAVWWWWRLHLLHCVKQAVLLVTRFAPLPLTSSFVTELINKKEE
jgi:hypothetical protein